MRLDDMKITQKYEKYRYKNVRNMFSYFDKPQKFQIGIIFI